MDFLALIHSKIWEFKEPNSAIYWNMDNWLTKTKLPCSIRWRVSLLRV